MGSTIVAGFEIAAIAQIDAKYVRMSKLGGGQGNASFMAPAEARAVAYALLRSADEVDGGDRAVGAVTHGRPAEGPCSRASHTGVRCGNAARYVDAAGLLTCGICPIRFGLDSIKIASIPDLLVWCRRFVSVNTNTGIASAPYRCALADIIGKDWCRHSSSAVGVSP